MHLGEFGRLPEDKMDGFKLYFLPVFLIMGLLKTFLEMKAL